MSVHDSAVKKSYLPSGKVGYALKVMTPENER